MERDPYFRSVNWTTGMLLTPEHFLRQDRYVEEQVAWLLRYCLAGTGLVGGGVRLDAVEQGLAKFDPKIDLVNDGDRLRITVLRARGITPSGEIVEVDESRPLHGEVRRGDLAGVSELLVYVVRMAEKEPDPESVGRDPGNPNQAALNRIRYEVQLGITAELGPMAIAVGRLRRASESLGFELDGQYIPPCASLIAHSALHNAATRIQSEVRLLSNEYQLVHERAGHFADRTAARGVDVRSDLEIRAFVERAVLALETAAYETADLAIPPVRFFQQIERASRLIALALNLSPSTRQFFKELGQVDAGYTELLDAEQGLLAVQRELDRREELRPLVVRSTDTLQRLRRLVDALAGKYVDYRQNRNIESIRFMLDRDGEHFYEAVTSPSHPQRDGDLLTFVFTQLELSGRHEYRVVLTGDPRASAQWAVGQELSVTLRVNASGGPRAPMTRSAMCEVEGQRNFAVNFDTPQDVTTIAGLTVTVQPGHGIRGAVLFRRRLGVVGSGGGAAMPLPAAPPIAPEVPAPAPAPSAESPASPRPPKIKVNLPKRS
ncbi:MAG: type VI secretion system baseplate subunit TssK [Gemmatimonadales bacterium]|nr:type VI secretion system baseplate subunit TssK [Gemmatimonadales bacterium]